MRHWAVAALGKVLWSHNSFPLLCYWVCNGVVPGRTSHCGECRSQSAIVPFWFCVTKYLSLNRPACYRWKTRDVIWRGLVCHQLSLCRGRSTLKSTVHNYCFLLLFAAGKAGASTAPNIPDMLFPHFPFFACTKHPTSKGGTDLCRYTVMPTSSHVHPTVWSQRGPPSLPHLSSHFPVPIPLCHLLCAVPGSSRCPCGTTGGWLLSGANSP